MYSILFFLDNALTQARLPKMSEGNRQKRSYSSRNRHNDKNRNKNSSKTDQKVLNSKEKPEKEASTTNIKETENVLSESEEKKYSHKLDNYKAEDQTKITIRNLPPRLTEEAFKNRISSKKLPEFTYFHFSNADPSLAPWHTSQVYINFRNDDDCLEFYRNWNGFNFGIDVEEEEEVEEDQSGNAEKENVKGMETINENDPEAQEKRENEEIQAHGVKSDLVQIQGAHLLKLDPKTESKVLVENAKRNNIEDYFCYIEIAKFQKTPKNSESNKIIEHSEDSTFYTIQKELDYAGSIFAAQEYADFLQDVEGKKDNDQDNNNGQDENDGDYAHDGNAGYAVSGD